MSYLKNDDAIGNILGNGLENDDIQVINRDEDLFQNDFNSNLFDEFGVPDERKEENKEDNADDKFPKLNNPHNPHNPHNAAPNANPANYNFPRESYNDLISHQNNQLATLSSSKYLSSPLPALPPLSESVNIPHIQPLSLTSDEKNKISKKKKEPSGNKTRPAFVMKIWSMVNDPANKEYIRWNDDGKTFQVFHTEEFMKVILPKYFKHNNFASFVRQLNMYGWHKVQDITNGTLHQGKVDNDEICQFENPYFIRDRKDLLDKIVRNKSVNQAEEVDTNNINFNAILNELDQIKMNQMAIGEDLRRVRKDNKTLWQENFITRERHLHQAKTLDKILNFLAAVYGNNAGKILEVDGLGEENSMTQFQPNPYASPQNPYQKPRLMLTNQEHRRSDTGSYRPINQSPVHRDSTDTGSIEEIMRSYGNTPNNDATNNVNKIFQQLINQEPGASSPRHYFPELMASEDGNGRRGQINAGNAETSTSHHAPSTSLPSTSHPGDSAISPGPFIRPPEEGDLMHGLEQNVFKQGQSIQQVQDWIQKLATQQQQHQATINEIHDELKPDLDEFDVNEFLNNNNNSSIGTPVKEPEEEKGTKRSIDDVYGDIMEGDKKRKNQG